MQCAAGFHGKPKAKPCLDESEYELEGCEKILHCIAPKESTGYEINEEGITAHDFKVKATCTEGYSGTAKVDPCLVDNGPYTLSGCEKTVLCLTPKITEGYQVTESSLERRSFSVTATCAPGYLGEAAVEACGEGAPYALRGCEPDRRTCGVPEDTTGYILQARSLQFFNFQVAASCADGFSGKAFVEPCTAHGEAFKVAGCSKISYCSSPVDQRGYAITEMSKTIQGFQVEAKCAAGYFGKPSVTVCTKEHQPYALSGCTLAKACKGPTDSEGYKITEVDVQLHQFSVTAKCADGFIGEASVAPCTDNMQEYRLSGCTPISTCVSPKDAHGYIVDEQALTSHALEVSVRCASGFSGKPTATACEEHLKPYLLSGCYKDGDTCKDPADSTGYLLTENDLKAKSLMLPGDALQRMWAARK